jgi:hypothetical protein
MIAAFEKLTNEAGQTFVLLPLEEYEIFKRQNGIYDSDEEELADDAVTDLRLAATESQHKETVSAEELQTQLGLPKNFPVEP